VGELRSGERGKRDKGRKRGSGGVGKEKEYEKKEERKKGGEGGKAVKKDGWRSKVVSWRMWGGAWKGIGRRINCEGVKKKVGVVIER